MKPLDPRLLRYARGSRAYVVATVATGTATAVLVVVQAGLVAQAIVERSLTGLPWLLATVLGRASLAWTGELVAFRSSASVKAELRAKVLRRVVASGPGRLGGARRGEVTALVTRGLDALDPYFARYLPQLFLAAIVPVVVLTRVAAADWTTAAIIVVTLPLIPVFMVLIGVTARQHMERQWSQLVRLSTHFLDVVAGLPTLRLFGRARAAAAEVGRVTDRYRRLTMGTLRVAFLSALVLELLATLSVGLVAVSVGLRLVEGRLGYETALLVLLLAPEVYLPIRQVGIQYHASVEGVAAAESAFAILDEAHLDVTPRASSTSPAGRSRRPPRLALQDVSVRYPGRSEPALDHLHLVVEPGECVALVGPSGAGKSTVLAVLLGFAETDGRILIDGDDLAHLSAGQWLAQVAWVPQRPHLFAASVADNVRLGDPSASLARVRAAAEAAGAAAFVDDLPEGYETVVGDGGTPLSAGQRQRIALARALLRDAPVLLLDEPTEHLDSISQRAILDALPGLVAGRTVIVVAHRLPLAGLADRIVVLESGVITSSVRADAVR